MMDSEEWPHMWDIELVDSREFWSCSCSEQGGAPNPPARGMRPGTSWPRTWSGLGS